MRLRACLVALSLFGQISVALNGPLEARQDGQQPPPSRTTAAVSPPPSDAQTDGSKASSTAPPPPPPSTTSSTVAASITSTSQRQATTTVHHTLTSTINTSSHPIPTNGTTSNPSEDLPIAPEVTPAYGLGGIILMLSGAVYGIMGVRLGKAQISFSMCYLVATAVTVLIVYVARPPISNAIQGAYFVAVFLPGLILGGVALIFPEITEGLGCLLGGFCFSMWLLCLDDGGLLKSTGGRAAIIAAFSLAAFALSFSKYTRDYGLIVCISFAGATATMLGIDCFTRAGLKEFWVYLWNLNEQLFPLGTNTYPLTRGMKAEIAGIVIIFICGVISQMKLWKIIKERREKKLSAREQDEEDREHLEADLGKQINETNDRERADWEAMYNNKEQRSSVHDSAYDSTFESTQSGFGTPAKTAALSIKEINPASTDTIEMTDMAARSAKRRESRVGGVINEEGRESHQRVTVRVAEDPGNNGDANARQNWESYSVPDATMSWYPSRVSSMKKTETAKDQSKAQEPTLPNVNPAPQVVPLPFNVPQEPHADQSDTESQATAGETAVGETQERQRPDRFSTMPNARHSVSTYDDDEPGFVEPGYVIPLQQRSRASSVAATLDEMTEDGASRVGSSRASSPVNDDEKDNLSHGISIIKRPGSADAHQPSDTAEEDKDDATKFPELDEGRDRSETATTNQQPRDLGQILNLSTSPVERPDTAKTVKSPHGTKRAKRVSIQSEAFSDTSLSGNKPLPEKLSNVAMAYRTNEWAKHLEVADKPEIEDLSSPPSPGIAVERVTHEQPAPVQIEDLQQTATATMAKNAAQNSAPNSTLSQGYDRSNSQNLNRSSSNLNGRTANGPPGIQRSTTNPVSNRNSMLSLKRSTSQPGAMYTSGFRNASTPLMSQPLHESPIEDMADMAMPTPGQTLLSQRQNLMRTKMTSTSFNNLAFQSTPSINGVSPSDSASVRSMPFQQDDDNVSLSSLKQQLMDEENMPLSQRRHLMHQRQAELQQQQQLQMQMQNLAGGPQINAYDSHQPRRGSNLDPATREARFANWRETMRRETGPTQAQVQLKEGDVNRAILLQNQRQMQMQVAQQKWAVNARDSAIDERMRSGQMIDLHKMALKKMQSNTQQEPGS